MWYLVFSLYGAGFLFAAYADFFVTRIRKWRSSQVIFWLLLSFVTLQIINIIVNDPRGLGGMSYLLMFLTGPALALYGLFYLPKTVIDFMATRASTTPTSV